MGGGLFSDAVMEMKLSAQGSRIIVSNHSPYSEVVSLPACEATYLLDSPGFQPSTRHAVEIVDSAGHSRSCLLVTSGGATGVHERSALVHDGRLIVAVGPRACSLRLPSLDLEWNVEVDAASCFGIYYSAKHDCFVSHGELAIVRVALDGTVVWSAGGKDIFSEGFVLHDDFAEVVDFNHETYRVDLATGDSSIIDVAK